jgi:nucleoside-diphosphate-sugar epimerase
MNDTHILLTGWNGFLGTYLRDHLNGSYVNLVTLGRSVNSDLLFDISKTIPTFLNDFDVVIHAAGKAHSFQKVKSEEQEFYNVNVIGTKNLLEALSRSSIPKCFVFISSVSVYGKDFGIGIDENTTLNALDPYGSSKIKAERLVLDWCKQHHVTCTILRLPLIVGSNPPGNLGAMIRGIQKGYYFNVAGGKARKSMVLAHDVAKFILKAAELGGIFNLTDGNHPNFNELSISIAEQLGKSKPFNLPFSIAWLVAKFGDYIGSKAPINSDKLQKITSNLTFDDSKAREAFGWKPTPVLEGLKITQSN